MIINDKKKVRNFLDDSLINCESWQKKDDYFDFPNFIILNDEWWNGGFEPSCTIEEKRNFYEIANQALGIITDFAKYCDETNCCIGPFHTSYNFRDWKNLKEFDSYNALKSLINNRQYLIVDVLEDTCLMGLIVENNFRYFSEIGLLFRKSNVLIEPTHNSEIIVFSDDCEKYKSIFSDIIKNTGWKICND